MTFESVTLHRADRGYQVTLWPDGAVRWDGDGPPRMGAWQALAGADWVEATADLLTALPSSHRRKGGRGGSLVVELSKKRSVFPLGLQAEPADVWRVGMVLDGICANLAWVPLDVSGELDFSPWAQGHWVTFHQGVARGHGLARSEGLLLLAGSTASTATAPTLEETYKSKRAELLEDGGLVHAGTALHLTRHVLFSSPSAPACVLAGSNTNGRRAWRDANGETWSDLGLG